MEIKLVESKYVNNGKVNWCFLNKSISMVDQIFVQAQITDLPKSLAMMINNEKQCFVIKESYIEKFTSKFEKELYNKWFKIFCDLISTKYESILNKNEIENLAKEKARFLLSINTKVDESYITNIRQWNHLAMMLQEELNKPSNELVENILYEINEFLTILKDLNIYNEHLLEKSSESRLSLYRPIMSTTELFNDNFSVNFQGTLATIAHEQKNGTINIVVEPTKKIYTPNIIIDRSWYEQKWEKDMQLLSDYSYLYGNIAIGRLSGSLDEFINYVIKEKSCANVQLESQEIIKEVLVKYMRATRNQEPEIYKKLEPYSHDSICLSGNFKCLKLEGITGTKYI